MIVFVTGTNMSKIWVSYHRGGVYDHRDVAPETGNYKRPFNLLGTDNSDKWGTCLST